MKYPLLFIALLFVVLAPSRALCESEKSSQRTPEEKSGGAIPQKALDVYNYVVLHGRAPEGFVGGAVWQNRERILPRGRYCEFDVNPKQKGVNRGPQRVVVDFNTNRGWYTADHYRTFIPIPPTHLKKHNDGKSGPHVH